MFWNFYRAYIFFSVIFLCFTCGSCCKGGRCSLGHGGRASEVPPKEHWAKNYIFISMPFMLKVTINVDGDQCYLMTATRSSVMREKMPWRPTLTRARHPARTSQPTLRQNFLKFNKPFEKGDHKRRISPASPPWCPPHMKRSRRKELLEDWEISIFSLTKVFWSLSVWLHANTDHYGIMVTFHTQKSLLMTMMTVLLSLGALPHESLQVTKTWPHNIIWNIVAENHCHQSLKDDPAQLFSKLPFKV